MCRGPGAASTKVLWQGSGVGQRSKGHAHGSAALVMRKAGCRHTGRTLYSTSVSSRTTSTPGREGDLKPSMWAACAQACRLEHEHASSAPNRGAWLSQQQ